MQTLRDTLELLCGQRVCTSKRCAEFPQGGLGLSQLNELLLSLELDLVGEPFFAFMVEGTAQYEPGMMLGSIEALRARVERFRIHAALRFGSIKFAFKQLSRMSQSEIENEIELAAPWSEDRFKLRHEPVYPIEPIDPADTYLLGYLVDGTVDRLLANEETRAEGEALRRRRDEVRQKGIRNQKAYLASDHMDVYVATSMREPHEYAAVNRIARLVFEQSSLAELRPRYFDPTQAYCTERIDKGLAEALMLKRAKCTIYLAQEVDTLGKDSELASTLAQGKPVVAYVPSFTTDQARDELARAMRDTPSRGTTSRPKQMLHHAMLFDPRLAWRENTVREWLGVDAFDQTTERAVEDFVVDLMIKHYDKRAKLLKDDHPLGIQVHLETGVANGVLVARTIRECAELVRRIMTNSLQFELREREVDGSTYVLLCETLTGSVFRVVTGDAFLTNAFWNYYI